MGYALTIYQLYFFAKLCFRIASHSQEGEYNARNLARGGSRSSCDSRRSAWSGHRERVSPGKRCENWHVETQRGEVQVQSRPGPAPQSQTLKVEASGQGEKFTIEGV